jgi:hypothetical protein
MRTFVAFVFVALIASAQAGAPVKYGTVGADDKLCGLCVDLLSDSLNEILKGLEQVCVGVGLYM